MLEWVDQVMMGPAIGVETGIPGGSELLQLILPLLLQVQGSPHDYLAYLIGNFHLAAPRSF